MWFIQSTSVGIAMAPSFDTQPQNKTRPSPHLVLGQHLLAGRAAPARRAALEEHRGVLAHVLEEEAARGAVDAEGGLLCGSFGVSKNHVECIDRSLVAQGRSHRLITDLLAADVPDLDLDPLVVTRPRHDAHGQLQVRACSTRKRGWVGLDQSTGDRRRHGLDQMSMITITGTHRRSRERCRPWTGGPR